MTGLAVQQEIVKFRPFRVVSGRVIVSAYSTWHKMLCDVKYRKAKVELIADLSIVLPMHVCNHNSELLYWDNDAVFINWWERDCKCYDVNGIPAFAHITEKSLRDCPNKEKYIPLTTNIVVREFHLLCERLNMPFVKLLN